MFFFNTESANYFVSLKSWYVQKQSLYKSPFCHRDPWRSLHRQREHSRVVRVAYSPKKKSILFCCSHRIRLQPLEWHSHSHNPSTIAHTRFFTSALRFRRGAKNTRTPGQPQSPQTSGETKQVVYLRVAVTCSRGHQLPVCIQLLRQVDPATPVTTFN